MSTIEETKASIEEYKNQLNQVEEAIRLCSETDDRLPLVNLKNDLEELLQLTEETYKEEQKGLVSSAATNENDDPFADEMNLFLTEMSSIDKANPEESDEFVQKLTDLKAELEGKIGQKCLAPHIHTWGSKTHHNAFICGLDDTNEYDENDLDQVKVRVFYTNPTHREMLPCSYYLDGNCRFDASKCRFSHGELVPYSDLKEYKEPDFSLLSKPKSMVLAKQTDRIWHKGHIISSDFQLKTCQIKLDHSKKEISCPFEDILPMHEENDSSSDLSESDIESTTSDDEYENEMKRINLIHKSLLTPALNQPLGEWEKYTKGFGSKIMQKYGYILGTGLGQNGEGIIVPINAQILPPGRSLDYCMNLREQSNGDKDLFSVERKIKKEQKKQEAINRKAYERDSQQTTSDIFSFINDNVFAGRSTSSETKPETIPINSQLQNSSVKNLNLAHFQISENIKKKEREISKLTVTIKRQKTNNLMLNKLKEQLIVKRDELDRLRKSETSITKEQDFRKNKSKLSIF